jgi:hypothetical protein
MKLRTSIRVVETCKKINNTDCLGRDRNLTSRHSVAQLLHLMKTEEVAFLKTQHQPFLLKTLKDKTKVLQVLL